MADGTLGVQEAKARFSELIERAERGEEIIVTRQGKAIARIGPPDGARDESEVEALVQRLRKHREKIRARFGGVSQSVLVPLEAVIAVYARETGQGMALPDDPRGAAAPMAAAASPASESEAPAPDGDGPDGPNEPPRRGGHLRIVK